MWEVRWLIYDNVYKMQQAITLRIGRYRLQCPWCIPRLWKRARRPQNVNSPNIMDLRPVIQIWS
jgi:hypothetical protein